MPARTHASKTKPGEAWPERAERVGTLVPPWRWHAAVRTWAARRPARERWAVAFSGGADSLALLLALWAHQPRRRRRLVALHFNHRLRGRESAGDAAFCRTVCRHLGVPLRSGAWEDAPVCASEAEARAARHEFFRREMKRVRTGVLWLAHQQDDVAESMLMRLARGSGTAGLAAPRPLQPQADGRVYVRPFLAVRKAELAAALRRAGARWRIDSSNARADHFRNRVRQKVLPGWVAAAGRDAIAGAALSRERLEEDDVALEGWLAELRPMDRRGRLDLSRMQARPRALWRRALQRWLLAQPHGSDLSRAGFEQLLAAVERGRDTRCSLGPRGFAVIRRGKLLFIDAGPR